MVKEPFIAFRSSDSLLMRIPFCLHCVAYFTAIYDLFQLIALLPRGSFGVASRISFWHNLSCDCDSVLFLMLLLALHDMLHVVAFHFAQLQHITFQPLRETLDQEFAKNTSASRMAERWYSHTSFHLSLYFQSYSRFLRRRTDGISAQCYESFWVDTTEL